ncbi:DUF3159 domain-containing protein [Nakamurella aerolata]|nr:DUF3159 domain-containing protein [Nakamurella aerolata]
MTNPTAPDRPDGPDGQDRPAADTPPVPTTWQQMGGLTGMIDSALPVVVFVIVNSAAGLGWAIAAAVATALVVTGFRLARKEPFGQAIGGLFGVAIAAFIAQRTGGAKGYFLLGIWSFAVYGGVLLASIVVRWPLIGVIWEGLNGRGTAWRRNRALVRKYDLATLLWVLLCAARFVVQRWLYDSDQVGWLAFARIAMGYPLFILVIIGTVLIVNSGSGLSPMAQYRQFREKQKTEPKVKPLTFRQRMEAAQQAQERKAEAKKAKEAERWMQQPRTGESEPGG